MVGFVGLDFGGCKVLGGSNGWWSARSGSYNESRRVW